MIKTILSALALVMAFSLPAFADQSSPSTEGQSKLKIKDVSGQTNKVSGDIDQEITNAKLRAESGSKSKYSLSTTLNYNGGSLETPLSENRPNITHAAVPQKVDLEGTLEGRYRLDEHQSVTAGTGFNLYTPLQQIKKGDVNNPYLAYHYVGKAGMFQNIVDAEVLVFTQQDDLDMGYVANPYVDNILMTDFHGSRASVGLFSYVDTSFFNKTGPKYASHQNDYTLDFDPIFEYAFTDAVSFRTVFRPWTFLHYRARSGMVFKKAPWTQSIGIGVAVARNVYLYPNFQFDWETWRANDYNWFRKDVRASSTIGLSATINVF